MPSGCRPPPLKLSAQRGDGKHHLPAAGPLGSKTSRGPFSVSPGVGAGSTISCAGRWHPGCRRCLLKGCEHWFLPCQPQARYCSPACQGAARHWRGWMARQRYRATQNGRQHRRDQARRARQRCRQRSSLPERDHPAAHGEPAPPAVEAEPPLTTDPSADVPTPTVGQRPAEIPENISGRPCHRPGCYVRFLPSARSPDQKFCSAPCRQALRRVRQREARLRLRRRHGGRPRRRPHRGPPSAVSLMSSRIENAGLPL